MASKPSISGMLMSMRMTSNGSASALSTARRPFSTDSTLAPALLQHHLDEFSIVVAVFGQQDANAFEGRAAAPRGMAGGVQHVSAGSFEHGDAVEIAGGHGQGEGASLPQHAGRGQFSAEQLGDLARDGQPQTGAAELLRDAASPWLNGWNNCGRTSSRMPMPVSMTSIRTAGRPSRQSGEERGHDRARCRAR